MSLIHRLAATKALAAVILIRFIVGGVFLSEGIQKTWLRASCVLNQNGI